tara:strand:- start:67546 stop:67839 length:294 start_codon:yes stop_codon:yes gene_type:complete
MNQDVIQGKWNEIKGEIRKAWGNVTGDELEQTKGNLDSISGIIQQKYGQRKEDVSEKLKTIVGRFQQKAESKYEELKDAAVKKTDEFKQDLRDKKSH